MYYPIIYYSNLPNNCSKNKNTCASALYRVKHMYVCTYVRVFRSLQNIKRQFSINLTINAFAHGIFNSLKTYLIEP